MNKKLYKLRQYAYLLEQGIDPITNKCFKKDTILNNAVIREYNYEVRCVLEKLIKLEESRNGGSKRNNKISFYLSEEEKAQLEYSKEPIPISVFCNCLNEHIYSGMKRIRATQITKWLLNQGYLQIEQWQNDKYFKKPTNKGAEIGISSELKCNDYGDEYEVNLYDSNAQRFIVDHLEEIVFSK